MGGGLVHPMLRDLLSFILDMAQSKQGTFQADFEQLSSSPVLASSGGGSKGLSAAKDEPGSGGGGWAVGSDRGKGRGLSGGAEERWVVQVFRALALDLDANGHGRISREAFDLSHLKKSHDSRSTAAPEVPEAEPTDADADADADADLPDLDQLPSMGLVPVMRAQYSHLNESFGEVSGGGSSEDSASAGKTFANEDASLLDGAVAFDEACSLLCDTLGLEPGEALLLLVHFDFDRKRAVDAFLRDPDGSRQVLGLPPPGAPLFLPQDKDATCQICFEETEPSPEVLPCGHRFCAECWTQTLQVRAMHASFPLHTKSVGGNAALACPRLLFLALACCPLPSLAVPCCPTQPGDVQRVIADSHHAVHHLTSSCDRSGQDRSPADHVRPMSLPQVRPDRERGNASLHWRRRIYPAVMAPRAITPFRG